MWIGSVQTAKLVEAEEFVVVKSSIRAMVFVDSSW
jgi:hypothetical protein